MSEFNIVDSLIQGLRCACQGTEAPMYCLVSTFDLSTGVCMAAEKFFLCEMFTLLVCNMWVEFVV